MSHFSSSLLGRTAGLAALSGARSIMGLALLSRQLRQRPSRRLGRSRLTFMQSSRTAKVLTLLTAGELLGDKLPSAPDRISFPALTGTCPIGSADWGHAIHPTTPTPSHRGIHRVGECRGGNLRYLPPAKATRAVHRVSRSRVGGAGRYPRDHPGKAPAALRNISVIVHQADFAAAGWPTEVDACPADRTTLPYRFHSASVKCPTTAPFRVLRSAASFCSACCT